MNKEELAMIILLGLVLSFTFWLCLTAVDYPQNASDFERIEACLNK
jgi:hypothetical protein